MCVHLWRNYEVRRSHLHNLKVWYYVTSREDKATYIRHS
nr:MAG TPA: hypothetical protein [Caudoviricetes sp.]